MPQIFISYRRSDSETTAAKIFDALSERFGKGSVFFDRQTIELAEEFDQRIVSSLVQSQLVLIIIGKDWVQTLDQRKNQNDDWVRRELEIALDNQIDVAPILIDGASMPNIENLPPSLQNLDLKNGFAINPDKDWVNELDTLKLKIDQRLTSRQRLSFKQHLEQQSYCRKDHQFLVQNLKAKSADNLDAYRLKTIAQWLHATPKKLDECFVELILMIDHGKNHQGGHFQENNRFSTLKSLMAHQPDDLAMVLLGPPGCGKSTLLKHLAYQVCYQVFCSEQDNSDNEPKSVQTGSVPDFIPFYVELNQFPPTNEAQGTDPLEWLKKRWKKENPELPELETLLQQQRVLLLLDALNEMRCGHEKQYRALIQQWKTTLKKLNEQYPQTRVMFSCRSLDYSANLSDFENLPVPQIQFADMSEEKVKEYLKNYLPDHWQVLYKQLQTATGLSIEKTPFYLNLAIEQFEVLGQTAPGQSALIAGMIWLALEREINKIKEEALRLDSAELLSLNDLRRIDQRLWRQAPHNLPTEGVLLPALIRIAGIMQRSHSGQDQPSKQINLSTELLFNNLNQPQSIKESWVKRCLKAFKVSNHSKPCPSLSEEDCKKVIKIAERLNLMEHQWIDGTCKFQHQLMQEYFAAHDVVDEHAKLFQRPYKASEVKPDVESVKKELGVADPLPPPPPSGWEQTVQHAAAISKNTDDFIQRLMAYDLVLAGQAAHRPEVNNQLNTGTIQQLQNALLQRCQDSKTDLRVRIEAGLALGHLGDPRFKPETNDDVTFIRPPMVKIPGGTYTMGNDQADEANEKPQHQVTLDTFELGQYPITNREWACFMDAGGYTNERWWTYSDKALAWFNGENEQTNLIEYYLRTYKELKNDFEAGVAKKSRRHWTTLTIENWRKWISMPQSEFEDWIKRSFRARKFDSPGEWDNSRFNNPSQPVVGICWYEALAYCQWLSQSSGEMYRLPSEAQWRATAQGTKNREYPWGNQRDFHVANTFESHIRRSTPIGLYKENVTPRESSPKKPLFDLEGNVWEWSLSLYDNYPIKVDGSLEQLDNEGRRVVTGGAWVNALSAARCGYRYYTPPYDRIYNLGFRVLREPTSFSVLLFIWSFTGFMKAKLMSFQQTLAYLG